MQEFVPRRSCTGQERAPGTSGDGRHGASLGRHRRAHAWVLGAAHPPAVGLALGAGGRAGRHDRATLCCRARCAQGEVGAAGRVAPRAATAVSWLAAARRAS
jgi:hypothetical protein